MPLLSRSRGDHTKSKPHLALATLALLLGSMSCATHDEKQDESPATADAKVLPGGLIVRDSETRSDIERTRSVVLPEGDSSGLTLIVTKSRYRLDVLRDGEVLKTFPIALGDEPQGTKLQQGDERTPEGEYVLIPHHPSPSFGNCFYIAYPNLHDADRGLAAGRIDEAGRQRILAALDRKAVPPHGTALGGLILLHGRYPAVPFQTSANWTDGCIAMRNEHLEELLRVYSRQDRPVLRIRP